MFIGIDLFFLFLFVGMAAMSLFDYSEVIGERSDLYIYTYIL